MDSEMPELEDVSNTSSNMNSNNSSSSSSSCSRIPTTNAVGNGNSISSSSCTINNIPNGNSNWEMAESSDDEDECDWHENSAMSALDGIDDDAAKAFMGCQLTECLVCDTQLPSQEQAITHMAEAHQFDLVKICISYKLDQIFYIKLINFIRRNKSAISQIQENSVNITQLDDSYMKPSRDDDPFLLFDIEMHIDELRERGILSEVEPSAAAAAEDNNNEDAELQELRHMARVHESTLNNKDAELDELRHLLRVQRTMIDRMVPDVMAATNVKKEEVVGDRSVADDAGYFDSYASYEIHHEMLSDSVRTDSYRLAITKNPSVLEGRRVLDLGCGTGILSVFCARAGAKSVTALDMADVAYDAMEIIRHNQLEGVVSVHRGRLEDQCFPEKFDVLVSEWMGYFLLFEGMLDSVISARDRFLKPEGIMMPNRCTMMLAAVDDRDLHEKYTGFWDDVYGVNMSNIKSKFIANACTLELKGDTVATSAARIAEFDLNTCSTGDTQFTSSFSLVPTRSTQLTAFAGYFDTYFDLPQHPVMFSTGAHVQQTHWKQTVFLLHDPITVEKDVALEGSIQVKRHSNDVRALEVVVTLADSRKFSYTVQ